MPDSPSFDSGFTGVSMQLPCPLPGQIFFWTPISRSTQLPEFSPAGASAEVVSSPAAASEPLHFPHSLSPVPHLQSPELVVETVSVEFWQQVPSALAPFWQQAPVEVVEVAESLQHPEQVPFSDVVAATVESQQDPPDWQQEPAAELTSLTSIFVSRSFALLKTPEL
jgi:hypothetical protein